MPLYTFGSAMCSFIAFLSRTECQASRISLCFHTDDLSTISTFSKSIWWLLSIWYLANHLIPFYQFLTCLATHRTFLTAKYIIQILLNSLVCSSSKTFNHSLNHNLKIHTAHWFYDFRFFLSFRQLSTVKPV